MEFLEDVTLRHGMVGRPLDIETLLSLGVEIADGFDSKFAGAQGRFHASYVSGNRWRFLI
jgi:hypothetical protein